MKQITLEMPRVSQCSATQCAYNVGQGCHAKAITVGDHSAAACDTHFNAQNHIRQSGQIAGVGACKVAHCKFNDDFECTAESIQVGYAGSDIRCLTYTQRKSTAA